MCFVNGAGNGRQVGSTQLNISCLYIFFQMFDGSRSWNEHSRRRFMKQPCQGKLRGRCAEALCNRSKYVIRTDETAMP